MPTATTLLVSALLLSGPAAAASLPKEPERPADTVLDGAAARAGGDVGVHAVRLADGAVLARGAGRRYPMASVYKLPIALVLYRAADAGALDLAEEVAVSERDLRDEVPGATIRAGRRHTLAELADRMLTLSDNTACDLLLARLGGPKKVEAALRDLGVEGIDVTWTELEMANVWSGVLNGPASGLTRRDARALRARSSSADRARGRAAFLAGAANAATPEAITRLLVRLERGELLSKAGTARLVGTMERNRTGDRRIRARLPKDARVADKTGTAGSVTNDVALLTLPNGKGRLALAIFVSRSDEPSDAREKAVAEIARAVYDEMSK